MQDAGFSGAVKLADLDDFLAPSQECIKPLITTNTNTTTTTTSSSSSSSSSPSSKRHKGAHDSSSSSVVTLELEGDDEAGVVMEAPLVQAARLGLELVASETTRQAAAAAAGYTPQRTLGVLREDTTKETATVSLDDCLACSGCVTSAETVLITQQSGKQFLAALDHPAVPALDASIFTLPIAALDAQLRTDREVFVTLSPHSRAALAARLNVSGVQMAWILTRFFKALGVHRVLDATLGQDIALMEAQREFVERFRAKSRVPVLASECPGWACYAEKTLGVDIVSKMSNVKSPQQVMGTLVKSHLATSASVYHAAVMPCYDKKLEGSRPDFYDESRDVRDVDCVLASNEVLDMLTQSGLDFASACGSLSPAQLVADLDPLFSVNEARTALAAPLTDAAASGGYTENVFRHAARELFGVELDPTVPLELKPVRRSKDLREVVLRVDGEVKLRFATAYGFRHIQNLARKMRRGKCRYDYVEIMACPAGCMNGGGQPRFDDAPTPKARRALVRAIADQFLAETQARPLQEAHVAKRIAAEWLGANAKPQALYTSFRALQKSDGLDMVEDASAAAGDDGNGDVIMTTAQPSLNW